MPDETFPVRETDPVKPAEPEPETVALNEPVPTEVDPFPTGYIDTNPHGRVTGEVTTDLETGKIIKASYPQDGAATHK